MEATAQTESVRLYLKHSPQYRDGWTNIDHCPNNPGDGHGPFLLGKLAEHFETVVLPLQWDEIWADEVLHRIAQVDVVNVLKHWRSLLKRSDSTLTVEVMDAEWACNAFLNAPHGGRFAPPDDEGNPRGLVHFLIGPQKCGYPCGEYRSLFDAQYLLSCLLQAGFGMVERVTDFPAADRRIRFVAQRGALDD